MSFCVLVIGRPRTGTSCVCGILHNLCIRMTLNEFVETTDANPLGFYEDKELMHTWIDPIILPQSDKMTLAQKHILMSNKKLINNRISSLIKKRCEPGVKWGTKLLLFPCISVDTIIKSCEMPIKVIYTDRDMQSSSKSSLSAFNIDYSNSVIEDRINKFKSEYSYPSININFNNLIDNPSQTVSTIANFIEEDVTQQAIDLVKPELRHF